jgi:hypothetical protein
MNRKILGILVATLLIATAVLPVVGTMNEELKSKEIINKNLNFIDDHELEIDWERLYGDSDDDLFRNVKQTVDGGYICVGVKDGQSHWLFKIDANGDEEWSQTTLPNPDLWPRCYIVEQTSDGGFVTAGCHEDGIAWGYDRCIWKVDSNGDTEWCNVYDDPQLGYHMCIQETSDGGFIVSGEIDYNYTTEDWDVLLMKTDSTGNVEWQKIFRYGEFGDCAYAVRQTPDGGYILSGRTGGSRSEADFLIIKTDSNGNKEWDKTYGGDKWEQSQSQDILFTNDGGYIFLAETRSFGAGNLDIWLIKTNSQGDMLWNKTIGERKTDMCGGMDFTDDDGIIIAGSKNSWDMMPPRGSGRLIKTDLNGNIEWQKEFGDEKEDHFQSVCSTNDGGYIVAGLFTSTDVVGAGGYDAWLIKIKSFDNNPPEKPDTPSGKKRGKPDTEYTFSTSSSDLEGDEIFYMWDWGDGNYSDWLETTEANYTWTTENNFEIKVMAKDEHGGESDWSEPLSFSTPKNKAINTPFLRFLENHPHLFPLLRQLLRL